MTNKIMAACAVLLLAASAHASENTSQHTTTPFTGATVNPCNGEPIQYFGTCQNTSNTHADDDSTRVRTHMVCEAHGVAPDRTLYRFLTNTKHETTTTGGCGFEEEIRDRVRVISFGREQNFFLNATIRLRVNEQCQVVVEEVELEPQCRAGGNG